MFLFDVPVRVIFNFLIFEVNFVLFIIMLQGSANDTIEGNGFFNRSLCVKGIIFALINFIFISLICDTKLEHCRMFLLIILVILIVISSNFILFFVYLFPLR